MSFVINFFENDTFKYWKTKLRGKWYKYPFLISKNLEMDSFMSEYTKPSIVEYKGIKTFELSTKKNCINEKSTVAVVVPIYVRNIRGKKQIEALIQSLHSQSEKPDYIFLVDDCSPVKYETGSISLIKMAQNGGPAKARNKGIELALESKVDIIAFTDSDVVLTQDWIKNIKEFFIRNKKYQALSGKTVSYRNTWYDLYHNINGTLNGRKFKSYEQLLYGPTCNFSVEAKSIENLRFSTDYPFAASEDIDFCFQYLSSGNNIGYAEKVLVNHDFGFTKWKHISNRHLFVNSFKKYAKGERILLSRFPQYYYFLNETEEISNL